MVKTRALFWGTCFGHFPVENEQTCKNARPKSSEQLRHLKPVKKTCTVLPRRQPPNSKQTHLSPLNLKYPMQIKKLAKKNPTKTVSTVVKTPWKMMPISDSSQ